MFIAMLLLTVLALALLVRDFRNKYVVYLSLMIVGLSVSLFSSMTVLAKIGMYGTALDFTSFLDYELFLRTSNKLALPISVLTRIMNLSRSVYLATIPLMVFEFSRLHGGGASRSWTSRIGYVLFFVFPFFLGWLYDDKTALLLFGWIRSGRGVLDPGQRLAFITLVDVCAKGLVIFYLSFPLALLLLDFRRTAVRVIRGQILTFAASLFFLNAVFFLSSYLFFIRPDVRSALNAGMWYLSAAMSSLPIYLIVVPVIVFACFEMIFVNVLGRTIVSYFHGLRVMFMRHYFSRYNNVLRDVLHSYKNTIFSLSILSEKARREYGTDGGTAALAELHGIISNTLANTGKLIGVLREIRLRPKQEDLVGLVEETTSEFMISSNVEVALDLPRGPLHGCVDYYHIRQTLQELLRNAEEAVLHSGRTDGRILIALSRVGHWIHLSIRDNGIGIPRRSMSHLFKSFVTTKDRSLNWGIGLSYVKKVVKGHLGQIWAESRRGEYTAFQVLLPGAQAQPP
jgi:signal transduction histidine kinase